MVWIRISKWELDWNSCENHLDLVNVTGFSSFFGKRMKISCILCFIEIHFIQLLLLCCAHRVQNEMFNQKCKLFCSIIFFFKLENNLFPFLGTYQCSRYKEVVQWNITIFFFFENFYFSVLLSVKEMGIYKVITTVSQMVLNIKQLQLLFCLLQIHRKVWT